MTASDMLVTVIGILTGGHGAYYWYDKKRRDKTLDSLTSDMKNTTTELAAVKTQLDSHSEKFVTDPRAREIVKEEVAVIKEDVAETKEHVSEIHKITQELVTEIRVMNAVENERQRNQTGD